MNKKNKHTNLTTLSPIEHRPNDPDGRVERIKEFLSLQTLGGHDNQLMRNCPMVHMARIQVIDNILPSMGANQPDSLKSSYLLMVAEIDGEVDDYLDALYNGPSHPFSWTDWDLDGAQHSDYVHRIWGQCIGYPQQTGAVFFRNYIHRCRIKVMMPYAAYTHTVSEIQKFESRQARFAEFVASNQRLGQEDLYAAWKSFRQGINQHPGVGDQ